jgi:predicted  nucleic acid-binding Zn-ribbon protein
MTVVYEIVDETEWRKTNALSYSHNGLSAFRVSAADVCEKLDEADAEVTELNRLMVGWTQRATMSETDLEASKAEVARIHAANEKLSEKLNASTARSLNAQDKVEFYTNLTRAYVAAAHPIMEMADKLGLKLGECIITKGVPLLLESHRKLEEEIEPLRSENAKLCRELAEARELIMGWKVKFNELWERFDGQMEAEAEVERTGVLLTRAISIAHELLIIAKMRDEELSDHPEPILSNAEAKLQALGAGR